MAIERTFSIIKPDATARNLTGAVNALIEKAGLRIVAEIDAIGAGFEDHFVQAYDFTFAERCDFEILVLACCFAYQALGRNRCA